jgi:hypothetical protein
VSLSARTSACLLLAVLVGGGVLTPSLHRLHHAETALRARAVHEVDGHHSRSAHGPTWEAPCPDVPTDEISCAVCAGLAFAARFEEGPAGPPAGPGGPRGAPGLVVRSAEAAGAASRGPPTVA